MSNSDSNSEKVGGDSDTDLNIPKYKIRYNELT